MSRHCVRFEITHDYGMWMESVRLCFGMIRPKGRGCDRVWQSERCTAEYADQIDETWHSRKVVN
jgi:hypothetical protein